MTSPLLVPGLLDQGAANPGPAWIDLDERGLDGATIVGDRLTVWPNRGTLGSDGDAVLDPTDGSIDTNGFLVGADAGHSTVTAEYAGGDASLDSRLTVTQDLGAAFTIFTLRTVGADAPADLTEMCPLDFDPANDSGYYDDWYISGGDRPSSYTGEYLLGAQTGGPQVGDTLIQTQVRVTAPGDVLSLNHTDGFEATPQTLYGNAGQYASTSGVMLCGYPGGGYCAPGRVRRVLIWNRVLSIAERRFVRELLRAQAAADGETVTLYDEAPIPWPIGPDYPGTLIPGEFTIADLDKLEWWDTVASPYTASGGNVTEWEGVNGTVLPHAGTIPETVDTTPTGAPLIHFEGAPGLLSISDAAWGDAPLVAGATVYLLCRVDDWSPAVATELWRAVQSSSPQVTVNSAGAGGRVDFDTFTGCNVAYGDSLNGTFAVAAFGWDEDRRIIKVGPFTGKAGGDGGALQPIPRPRLGGDGFSPESIVTDVVSWLIRDGRDVEDDMEAIAAQMIVERIEV